MKRDVALMFLCLMLACMGVGCAPKQATLSKQGYAISLHPPDSPVLLGGQTGGVGELVVRVRDTQGQPVDGVPVDFDLDPSWLPYASITPQRALTRDGKARAIVEPRTTGLVQVMVRVDDATQNASFLAQDIEYGVSTAR